MNRGDIIHKRLESERHKLKKLKQELNKKAEGVTPQQQKDSEE